MQEQPLPTLNESVEPYLFANFSKQDLKLVNAELTRLKSWGLKVWCNEGNRPDVGHDQTAEAVASCSYFIYFVSERSVSCERCRSLVCYAQTLTKPILFLYLEPTDLTDHPGLLLVRAGVHSIEKHNLSSHEYHLELAKALGASPSNIHHRFNRLAIYTVLLFIIGILGYFPRTIYSAIYGPPKIIILNTPTPTPPPVVPEESDEKQAKRVVEDFLQASDKNDDSELSFYAPSVDYFGSIGNVNGEFIRKDIAEYNTQWPNRQFTLIPPVAVISSKKGDMELTFCFNYSLKNGDKFKMNVGGDRIHIKKIDEKWKIVSLCRDDQLENGVVGYSGNLWKNSLGMTFVPAGTTGLLFSAYDTRVEDFQVMVTDTNYQAISDCRSLRTNQWGFNSDYWGSPGFDQSKTCPVVGVSWNDAEKFCQWLTDKERKEKLLKPDESYRLPTDAEWSTAAGAAKYPWGETWPPPLTAGNFCRQGDKNPLAINSALPDTDNYGYTSPVGSFSPNSFGIYDLSGNVWQWCEPPKEKTLYYKLRGGSWTNNTISSLETISQSYADPKTRVTNYGFRCVFVTQRKE